MIHVRIVLWPGLIIRKQHHHGVRHPPPAPELLGSIGILLAEEVPAVLFKIENEWVLRPHGVLARRGRRTPDHRGCQEENCREGAKDHVAVPLVGDGTTAVLPK